MRNFVLCLLPYVKIYDQHINTFIVLPCCR